MKNHFSENSGETVAVGSSRLRLQWLKWMARIEDHPKTALFLLGGVVGLVFFYGIALDGFAHGAAAWSRWRVETFGGTLVRERSIQLADPVIALRWRDYDRLDAIALGSNYIGINAFDEEVTRVLARPGARVRIIGLDPRLADPSHPGHGDFESMARAFGAEPWEYGARCWHAAAVLIRLQQRMGATNGDRFEIRLVSSRPPDAGGPYFDIGRSAHFYDSTRPGNRLDILVPRPLPPTGTDPLTHPGRMVLDRPEDPDVMRFVRAFDQTWTMATPLDPSLRGSLLTRLHGPTASGNQP